MRTLAAALTIATSLPLAPAAVAAPHYRSCPAVNETAHRIHVYASEVSCATALTVERRCRAANCFGQLPMLTPTDFELPTSPASKPLGFSCWQAYGRYAAGLPLPPRGREVFLIVCEREAMPTSSQVVRQLVAYSSE
jgi:hypothetical protein